jgi:hypothetical protein
VQLEGVHEITHEIILGSAEPSAIDDLMTVLEAISGQRRLLSAHNRIVQLSNQIAPNIFDERANGPGCKIGTRK